MLVSKMTAAGAMLISGENAVPPPKLPEYPKSGMIGFSIVLALVSVVSVVFLKR